MVLGGTHLCVEVGQEEGHLADQGLRLLDFSGVGRALAELAGQFLDVLQLDPHLLRFVAHLGQGRVPEPALGRLSSRRLGRALRLQIVTEFT